MNLIVHSETPNITTLSSGRLFVARWHDAPTAAAFAQVVADVERATRDLTNVCYVGISDEKSGTPDDATQKQMVGCAVGILRRVDAMHLVIEGDSIRSSLNRTLFRGMIMAAKLGNKVVGFEVGELARKITLGDSVDPLMKTLPAAVGRTRMEVAEAFERVKPR